MKRLELVIAPDGAIRAATHGFAGSGCLAASRPLLERLGATVSEQLTAEFYATTDAAATAPLREAP